jgi:hypothetical protein
MNTSSIRSGVNFARSSAAPDHVGTQLVRAERRQIAHEAAQRRGAAAETDDDGIGSGRPWLVLLNLRGIY